MSSSHVIEIDTSRADGKDGSQYSHTSYAASTGHYSSSGRSATYPTAGEPGRNIDVLVSYDGQSVRLTERGARGGRQWPVYAHETAHLDAHGGRGGNGGRGENGEDGGRGEDGSHASQCFAAQDGGPGGNGGDGGYGTGGANGGDAGNVMITVNESDLDCLPCVTWDLNGGKGGVRGAHGRPGQGGSGGRGGKSWSDPATGTTVHKSGRQGSSGTSGRSPSTRLSDGRDGRPGNSTICVFDADGSARTYPQRYLLRVVNYDIVDENEDGIYEPREHLIIKNLVVQNYGSMPSPKHNPITVSLVDDGKWLQPVQSMQLPGGMLPGHSMRVDGEIKVLIRANTIPLVSGKRFHIPAVSLKLRATFERLARDLPEFQKDQGTVKKVQLRYPIELDEIQTLASVVKGDSFKVTWTLRNVSTKDYGIDSLLSRRTATRSTGRNVMLSSPYSANTDLVEQDFIRAGQSISVTKVVKIPEDARTHSIGTFSVDLLLPGPNNPDRALWDPRAIATHETRIQICERHEHKDASRFLLIVNASVPSSAIDQIVGYIGEVICVDVDVFNITQYGSFIEPKTDRNILSLYEGKSIIICSNAFPFFHDGMREAWQLLDPWEVARLAKHNTSFLFIGASDSIPFREWCRKMAFPMPSTAVNSSLNAANLDGLIAELSPARRNILGPELWPLVHQYESHRHHLSFTRDTKLALLMRAQRDAFRLGIAYPLRRFILTPHVEDHHRHRYGTIAVSEGVPVMADVRISTLPFPLEGQQMCGHHKLLLASALPFQDQVDIFWASGTNSGKHASSPLKKKVEGPAQNSERLKFLQAIHLSLTTTITHEVTTFCGTSIINPLTKDAILSHLPHLQTLLTSPHPSNSVRHSEHMLTTLATTLAVLSPFGVMEHITDFLTHHHTRKGQIKTVLLPVIKQRLQALSGANETQSLLWSMHQQALAIKLELKKGKSLEERLGVLLVDRAKKIAGEECEMGYILEMDKQDERRCVAMIEQEVAGHREGYGKVVQNIERDEKKARDVLREYLVSPKA